MRVSGFLRFTFLFAAILAFSFATLRPADAAFPRIDARVKAALEELFKAQPQARDALARQAIRPRADRARAPMTLMQRRLWVLEQMAPGQVTYNTPSAHRLRGPIDLPAFEAAFNEMVRRQPSLRTCLVTEGDEAVQVVQDALHHRLLPPTDLSDLADEIRLPTLMARRVGVRSEK